MSQNIWDLADEIVSSVSDAITTENYSGLSQKIKNEVYDATSAARQAIDEAKKTQTAYYDPEQGKYVSGGRTPVTYNKNFNKKYTPVNEREKELRKSKERDAIDNTNENLVVCSDRNLPGRISSHVEVGFGIAGAVLFAYPIFATTFNFIQAILTEDLTAGIAFVWLLTCTAFGLSVNAIRKGKARIAKNKRFKQYKYAIGNKAFTYIEELAKEIGKSKGFVKRDLKKMIKEKYFLQGHFDKDETIFIGSNEVYDNYLHTENVQQQLINENKQDDARETEDSSSKTIVQEGREYISKIREANNRIPGDVMTEKLNTMEDIIVRIFDRVEKEPSSSDELRRMMKYYLPTTIKLLNAYIELDGQPSYGDNNVAKSKKEIEDTLDMINEAFGNIFDSMYEDTAWDISSDISTMKTMMKQDGLTGVNEFK